MFESLREYFCGNPQERSTLQERDELGVKKLYLSRKQRYRLEDLEEDAQPISRRLFWRRVGAVGVGSAGLAGVVIALRYFLVSTDSTKIAELTEDAAFEQVNCERVGVSMPKPKGWTVLEVRMSPTFINCYISQQPITREQDFRSGLRVSKLVIPEQEKIAYARQLASASEPGVFPQANTFKETKVGSFRIFSGRFTSTKNNILSDEERKIIVPNGSNFIYIAAFSAPKPSSEEDFRKYGRNMLDGIKINGLPTK